MTGRLSRLVARAGRDSKSHGFTLIEIMVASMLLMFALAGIVPLFIGGLSQASDVRYKSLATNIAREKMEQIRQLDYREISDGDTEDVGIETLAERFGTSETQRNIPFDIAYQVDRATYDTGVLKQVTVNVSWTGTAHVSAASMTTLIHQQFLGPRISDLEVKDLFPDPLGTPFSRVRDKTQGESMSTSDNLIRVHVAQADWGLVYNDLDQPGETARDVYARVTLFDDKGQPFQMGSFADDYKITNLVAADTNSDGQTDDVYFQLGFAPDSVPDGYWEMRAIVYNEYDEPGNVWRLRLRFENGAPGAPTGFLATPQPDNQTVLLTWYSGGERDRARYRLQRRWWDPNLGDWVDVWTTLEWELDPNATSYTDEGSNIDPFEDPWGDGTTTNKYQYRLWAVDIAGHENYEDNAAIAEASIPDPTSTTTTTSLLETTSTDPTTTTVFTSGSVVIVNSTNKTWTITIKDANNETVKTVTLDSNSSATIPELLTGSYSFTATRPGKTLSGSFSMPANNGDTVLEIL